MFQKAKISVGKVVNSPNARIIFILGTILIAALAGGAPSDMGGH